MRLSRILAVVGIPLMCGAAVLGAGAATAGAATKAPPTITANPSSTTVLQGTKASFLAAASSGTVQWEVSSDGGSTFTNIAGATGHRYTIAQVTLEQDGDEFAATFTNATGHVTTQAATLNVTPLVAPRVTRSPADTTVLLGATATFQAAGVGTPAPKVKWFVSKNEGATFSALGKDTATTLSVVATSVKMSGYQYEAIFTNSDGVATSAVATLSVEDAPVVVTSPVNDYVVTGATATFKARVSGTPTPTVLWMVSTDGGVTFAPVAGGTTTTLSVPGGISSTLSVPAVTLLMSGDEYEAVFTNIVSSATTSSATLGVGAPQGIFTNNWAGYADTGATFTSVSGAWNVPSVTCGPSDSAASEWVGIDGFDSTTVEQVGTDVACSGGVAQFNAWWEMAGDDSVATNGGYAVNLDSSADPVAPGDEMTGSVNYAAGNWTLTLSDTTQGWTFSTVVASPTPPPAQSSAEWIVERPVTVSGETATLDTLADISPVTFTDAQAVSSTSSGSIASFSTWSVLMLGDSSVLAVPEFLSGAGTTFTVDVDSPAS